MKITIITPCFPYPNRGLLTGIETYSENLAINFKAIGNDVKIVTTFWNGGKRYDIYKEIPILRILDSKTFLGRLGSIFQLNLFTFGFNLMRKKNLKFFSDSDVILLIVAIGFTRFFKIKKFPIISVFYHYESPRSFIEYITLPFFHYLEKKQFKKHKNVIALSNSAKNDIVKYYGLEDKNVKVIPIGINFNKFNPINKSSEIKKRYGDKLLLYSGLMAPRKRVSILLKAMTHVIKEIPDAYLILIGKGPLLNHYKNLSNSLGIQRNTTFLGFVKDEILIKFYASSEIFVFPSEKEGFGQVLLEALASGTPVVCANKLPMSEIIGNGGITFEVNDSRDLSKKIFYLLNNRRELNKFKENALKVAKKYEWKKIIRSYLEYIDDIIEKNRHF